MSLHPHSVVQGARLMDSMPRMVARQSKYPPLPGPDCDDPFVAGMVIMLRGFGRDVRRANLDDDIQFDRALWVIQLYGVTADDLAPVVGRKADAVRSWLRRKHRPRPALRRDIVRECIRLIYKNGFNVAGTRFNATTGRLR